MKIVNLKKVYPVKNDEPVQALKGVSFELPEKGLIFILGKSGSGKTTLLNLLAGMDFPSGGSIIFHGKPLDKLEKSERDYYRNTYCGFIFQEYNLLPELSVEENIALALEMQGCRNTCGKVKSALAQVDMAGYEKRKIWELSGGQKQRVAIARALIKNPEIIFADEPTGALDNNTGNSVLSLMKELSKEKLVVTVTHDREFAEKYGDRIIEIADGKIVDDTNPYTEAETETPENYVATKAGLPAKAAIKIGGSNFKYHPFRLLITVLLSTVAFAMFGIFCSFSLTDFKTVCLRSMQSSELTDTVIMKKSAETGKFCPLTDGDFVAFTEDYGAAALRILESRVSIEGLDNADLAPYYSFSPYGYAFVDESDLSGYRLAVNGRLAERADEAMITSYIADRLIAAGVKPSYGELLNSEISFDGQTFIITAIIDTGLNSEKFAALKNGNDAKLLNELEDTLSYSRHNLIFLASSAPEEPLYSGLLVSTEGYSQRRLAEIYSFAANGFVYEMNNSVIDNARDVYEMIKGYDVLFLSLSCITGFFAVALLFYFISQSIEDKSETINIIRIMGAGDRTVVKIFFWEGLLLGAVILILSLSACGVACAVFNAACSAAYNGTLLLFGLRFTDCLIMFSVIAACTLLGDLIPMLKIFRKRKI